MTQSLTDRAKQGIRWSFAGSLGQQFLQFGVGILIARKLAPIVALLAGKKFGAAFSQVLQMLRDVPGKIGWLFPLYQLRWFASFLKNRVRKTG